MFYVHSVKLNQLIKDINIFFVSKQFIQKYSLHLNKMFSTVNIFLLFPIQAGLLHILLNGAYRLPDTGFVLFLKSFVF